MKTHGLLFSAPMIRAFLRPVNPKTQTRRKITATNSLVDGNGMSAKRWADMNFDFSRAVVDQGPSPAGNPGPYLKVPARNVPLNGNDETWHRIYPRIDVGDVIYAKETWSADLPEISYRADLGCQYVERESVHYKALAHAYDTQRGDWRPSMFMPEWAARIRRTVTAVRPEPLLQISEQDAIDEGCRWTGTQGGRDYYSAHSYPSTVKVQTFNPSGAASAVEAYFHLWNQLNGKNEHLQNPRVWVYTLGAA